MSETTSGPELSVVIPAYDEEPRLGATLDRVTRYLRASTTTWEVVVVDDGSTDGTAAVARAASGDEPRIRLLGSATNRGKGHAVRTGVLASRGRQVLVCDADLSTPIEDLDVLRAALAAGADCAIGSRAHRASDVQVPQHAVRRLLGQTGNLLIRALATPGIADTQCGFKLFDGAKARDAFGRAVIDGWAFDVEILVLFARSGWTVEEAPVRWAHRPGSKLRPAAYAAMLRDLYRLRRRRVSRIDLAVAGGFLAASVLVFARFWVAPSRRYLVNGGQDQHQWEWFFAVTARAVTHFDNPFFTHLQNAPLGVNLMANTVMLGLSVPLTPVTLLLGPSVTWGVVLTGGLASTGFAWYWLLHRRLGHSRAGAAIGGGLCAFAPPTISHANAHPNFVVLFVLPLIIDRLVVLWRGGRPVRDGVLLGLLVAYQVFLGEEPLLLAATGLAVFGVAYAAARPGSVRAAARTLGAGLAVAAPVALALTVVPLLWQFTGPQSYRDLLHGPFGNDVLAIPAYAERSLGGPTVVGTVGASTTEQNSFFGWPLVVLVAVLAVWLRRQATAVALGAVIAVAAVLSLGPEIVVDGEKTGVNGPWLLVSRLPLYESVLESRLTMICVPAAAILIATAHDQVTGVARVTPWRAAPLRLVWGIALVQALLPIAPRPLAAADRPPTPDFFTAGLWREYVSEGRSILTVPPPDAANALPLRWQVDAGLGFAVAEGYFVGPYGRERTGVYGAVPRPTASLLRDVADSGRVPPLTATERATARDDLRFWRADAVVLGPHPRRDALRVTVDGLLGPGRDVGGVHVWDARRIQQ